jgi:hypothetical protein
MHNTRETMKSILLATASILAFAGAAAAQDAANPNIRFGGDASFGFNDSHDDPEESGFFYEANLAVTFSSTLSNGLVATSTFTIPIADSNINNGLQIDSDFKLGLDLGDQGGIFLGDYVFAAESHFTSFPTMQSADFSEQDAEVTLRADSNFAFANVSISYVIADPQADIPDPIVDASDPNDTQSYLDQLSIGADGTIGGFTYEFGYQEASDIILRGDDLDLPDDPTTPDVDESQIDESAMVDGVFDTDNSDFNVDEQVGIAVGTAFAGADVLLGFGRNLDAETSSYGVSVSYPFGPVKIGASYVVEPDAEVFAGADNTDPQDYSYALTADYDSGPIVVSASFGQEIGEEEYDIKIGYRVSEITTVQLGYNDDDGGFAAVRQAIGNGAYVEASYAESDDAGFDNDEFVGDIKEGNTVRIGFEF